MICASRLVEEIGDHTRTLLVLYKSVLTGDLEDGLGESLDIARRDASHGDTAVLGGVNRVFLGQGFHLLRIQAGVGEHADLKQKQIMSVYIYPL